MSGKKETKAPAADGQKAGREAALKAVMAKLDKDFGAGTAIRLGERPAAQHNVLSTGSLLLDWEVLQIGGLPRGRIVEIYGPESSGKTTICSSIIASAQRAGETVVFIDAEHAYDTTFAKTCGVNVDEIISSQPDNAEQTLTIAEEFIRSGAVSVVVVDSVAALVPRAEVEGEMGDAHVGLIARLMSQALRKLAGTLSKTDTIMIFTNQLREKIGVMYGNPETQPGGKALKFYSSVRLDVRKREAIKDGDAPSGFKTKIKAVKNKVAPPFREVETTIMFDEGISRTFEALDLGEKIGVIQKKGSFYTIEGQSIQGRAAAREILLKDAELLGRVEERIRDHYRSGKVSAGVVSQISTADEEEAA